MQRLRMLWWWIVAPLLITLYTVAWLIPASWWYEPISIHIEDAAQGTAPVVKVERRILRDYDGRYAVSVFRVPPDGHVACAGSDELRYRGGQFAPHETTLDHWSDDPWCARLGPGDYYAEACWTVLRPFGGLVPGKTICTTSNLFTVRARGSASK